MWRVILVALVVALAAVVFLVPKSSSRRFADKEEAIEALIGGDGEPEAVARVRKHLEWAAPDPLILRLADLGYRIKVNERMRDRLLFLPADLDYFAGATNPFRRLIVVSIEVRDPRTGRWFVNPGFDDVVDHEIGHALNFDIDPRRGGAAATPDYVAAWDEDFAQIPLEYKTSYYKTGGGYNFFRYLLYADGGTHDRARGETFAEGYEVLLRRSQARSSEGFHKLFPRALAVERKLIEGRYGRVLPPDDG